MKTEKRLTADLQAKLRELSDCVELLHETERRVEERTQWALSLESQRLALEAALGAVRGSRWYKLGRSFGLGPEVQPK